MAAAVAARRLSSLGSSAASVIPQTRSRTSTFGLDNLALNEVPSANGHMTLRHLLKMLRVLLSESHTSIAIHFLDKLSNEPLLSSSLDVPIAGVFELSAAFMNFVSSERSGFDSLLDQLHLWATKLSNAETGAAECLDLLHKLSKTGATDKAGEGLHEKRCASVHEKIGGAGPGACLADKLGLGHRCSCSLEDNGPQHRGSLEVPTVGKSSSRRSRKSLSETLGIGGGSPANARTHAPSLPQTHLSSSPKAESAGQPMAKASAATRGSLAHINAIRRANSVVAADVEGTKSTIASSGQQGPAITDLNKLASLPLPGTQEEDTGGDSGEESSESMAEDVRVPPPPPPLAPAAEAPQTPTTREPATETQAPPLEEADWRAGLAVWPCQTAAEGAMARSSRRTGTWPGYSREATLETSVLPRSMNVVPAIRITGLATSVLEQQGAEEQIEMSLDDPEVQSSRAASEASARSEDVSARKSKTDEKIRLSSSLRASHADQQTKASNFASGSRKRKNQKGKNNIGVFTEGVEEDKVVWLATPSNRFIINPGNGPRMTWDLISLIIISMESVILPLGLCFGAYPPDGVMWISTCFFIPDIILNFFTGFYQNGHIVMRHNIITWRYLTGWFPIDFFSTVPWEFLLPKDQGQASFMLKFAKIGKLMRVLRLLRILKLKTLLQRVEDLFSSYIVLFTLSITKTIATYVLFCHWTACIWGWLGTYDGDAKPYDKDTCEPDGPCDHGLGVEDEPWRRRYGIDSYTQMQQYLMSLQFATGLLTGAELQMMPGWWLERTFVIVMMIVSFLVCSMIISQIVVVMDKINQDNSEYLEQTRVIRDFMVSRGMPLRLQTKVKRYLEYQFKCRKVVHQNHEVMMKLSPFLRIEITEHMNRAILEHHPFFAGMEPAVFSQVCCLARSVLYAPGDVVMRKGQLTSLISFIVRGQLIIKDAREGVNIYIKAPAWIGDRGLFVTSVRSHNVVSSTHTEVLTIHQQDLIDLVKDFPSAEAYIKEYCQRVLANDPGVIFCPYCRFAGHDLHECEGLDDMLKHEHHHKEAGLAEIAKQRVSQAFTGHKAAQRKILAKSKSQVHHNGVMPIIPSGGAAYAS